MLYVLVAALFKAPTVCPAALLIAPESAPVAASPPLITDPSAPVPALATILEAVVPISGEISDLADEDNCPKPVLSAVFSNIVSGSAPPAIDFAAPTNAEDIG